MLQINLIIVDTSEKQRNVIKKFKSAHLQQQAKEREVLESRKQKALDDGVNQALFIIDGMTQYTTRTPKLLKSSKGDEVIESRLIGVEVFCGPVKTVFSYLTSAFVSGGANIIIEVVRQSIVDLCSLLKHHQMVKPKNLWLQFDNCGENKNKYMLAFSSLLVEDKYFDTVEIGFLIVGHTHSSIDQYFSTVSRAIYRANFISSPLALIELIRQSHLANERYAGQSPVIREIVVYYNVSKALEPLIDKRIKYISYPHFFLFTRHLSGRAIMKYKMFSYSNLLPPEPSSFTLTNMPTPAVGDEDYFDLSMVDEIDRFTEFLKSSKSESLSHNINTVLDDVIGTAKEMQEKRMIVEEKEGRSVEYKENKQLTVPSNNKKPLSDRKKGFIVYLKRDFGSNIIITPDLFIPDKWTASDAMTLLPVQQ